MKKKNLILLIVSALMFYFILISLYSHYFVDSSPPPEELEYLTNVEELYSHFTNHMKERVDSHLQHINCNPKKYYYDESAVCFPCEEMHSCFRFAFVQRNEGEMMNSKGKPYLKNYTKFSLEVADFYNDGMASLFECVEKTNEILLCADGIAFIKEYNDARMVLNDEYKLEDVSSRICSYYDKPLPSCEEATCLCGNKNIFFMNSELFVYDIIQ